MKLIAAPLLLLLVACSGNPASTTYYLLRSDVDLESRELQPSQHYGLGSFRIASYIDQPGLVLETRDHVIHQARSNRWAESLRDSLRLFFASEISAEVGEDVFFSRDLTGLTRINITINQLHGKSDGNAVLVGYWELAPPEGESTYFQFAETRALVGDGYDALVDAERYLLSRMADSIGRSLDTGSAR